MNIENLKTNIIDQLRKQEKLLPPWDTHNNSIARAQYRMSIGDISKAKSLTEVKTRLSEFGCDKAEAKRFINDMKKLSTE